MVSLHVDVRNPAIKPGRGQLAALILFPCHATAFSGARLILRHFSREKR